jgi:hypothetical protein
MIAAVGVGVSAALITTLLPTIARRSGLEPIGLPPWPRRRSCQPAWRVRRPFGRARQPAAVIRGLRRASLLLLFFGRRRRS